MAKRVGRLLLGAIGLGLLAVGAIRVSVATGGTGPTVLVLAGALLILSPFVIERVEELSVSGTGFQIRLTREIGALGAPEGRKNS
jgi:hypothetical protein